MNWHHEVVKLLLPVSYSIFCLFFYILFNSFKMIFSLASFTFIVWGIFIFGCKTGNDEFSWISVYIILFLFGNLESISASDFDLPWSPIFLLPSWSDVVLLAIAKATSLTGKLNAATYSFLL